MSRPQKPDAVLRKNQIITLHITGMTAEGNGVGRFCGLAVFVPMTAVGDTAEVRIVKVLKSYAFGIIEHLTEPAPCRMEPQCPVFRQCGGCVFQHVDAQTELQYKEQLVRDAFARIGRLSPVFEPVCGCESRGGYRNKAQYPVAEQDGHLVCGFYARHSHRVIPYTGCALHPPVFTDILETLLLMLEACGITAYNEETHTGMLRHIYLRRGYHSGEIMLCLVTRVSLRRKIAGSLAELQARFPAVKSITESVNPDRTNVILGKTVTLLAGQPEITDTMCGREIRISPQSFYQINTAQAERLYGIAKEYAGLHGTETLLDLYCGAGTVGLSMADACGKLIGVEIIPQAVENAKENAERNGIGNAEFFCGDAGTVAAKFAAEGQRPDVIVLDPPRKGCDILTVDSVVQMQPQRVVMISCNPATAARDAALFAERGYTAEKVRAVDLFPMTAHVETVVQLSKGDIDRDSSERKNIAKTDDIGMISGYRKGNKAPETTNVKIDFSLDNLDLSELKGKATYEQIKDYVREQTGFKVSSLYISQVKRKCGLEVGESYNKPKSEDAKQPQCTPEKEEAIMQALRHYGMI